MNLFKRGMIFVTFFGSCIAMALLVASLGTKQWVNAKAKRLKNPHESDGRINFGLFDGKKELNVAYGWRSYEIDVIHLLKYEPEFLIYWFWIGTVVSVCAGLLFSALSAIFAAINTATSTSRCLASASALYLWNILAMVADVMAIGFWIAQFYLRIQFNVLSREDRDNDWTSERMAELGYSFWFVVGAAVASFVNIIIVFIANSEKEVDTVIPVLEEKTNGAIMLY
ncbi:uncharacterized protein LOC100142086 [Tribolium castaneum]|uniref:Uncharacterized protein n=1 Tax=Tribolium castaneum TaxID=7070 RepID=D6X0N9_TRICA|nr:PREDICTED: uncharacterized protein LOC100142086 [Tribolium castaneum]EFA10001.2 hypothetical protein TcasGA2_TC012171 [Tribolium castaneum]|eukprot:XP_008197596.1 PREDICTED: uncharacterized protein LOC100142086 [Tribolium castaneum]